jgi:hypothetical protein
MPHGGSGEKAKDENSPKKDRAEQMMKLSQTATPRISGASGC